MKRLALSLLLLAASAGAQDTTSVFTDAKAVGADITARHAAQAERQEQQAAARAAQADADIGTLQQAGLDLSELSDAGWKPPELSQLAAAVRAGSKAVRDLHAAHPSAVADAYHNGTMTNIEDTFKLFGSGNLERGCLSHQAATGGAIRAAGLGLLEVQDIMIGKILEHHAVIVYPKSAPDWKKTGVVLDGWRYQTGDPKEMTFTFARWNKVFWSLPYPRLEK